MTMMNPRSATQKRRSTSFVSLLSIAFLLATIIIITLPNGVNASPCTPGSFRVRLNDCPVQQLRPRDGETVELEYIPIMVEFPLLYVDGDASKTPVWQHEDGAEDLDVQSNLIQGGTVRFQTKTFKSPGIEASIPCPTIYWPKGANVNVLLKNNLDRDVNDDSYRLNIHTHGLHIGPYEDDSGVVIRPTEEHLYDYHLPRNHGGGTHWYHPHINTLSELVVGGGTAGMMVVEDADDGSEVPDFILAMPEQVLVIQFIWPQRIMAISRGEVEGIVTPHRRKYVRDDLYTLEATDESNNSVDVPDTAFYYLVNGLMQPVISFVRNQWTRVRMLHTSNGHDVHLHVEGAECKMYLLAKDGVYLPQGPREEFGRNDDGQQHIRLTASTRADFAIRCTGLTPGGATPFVVAEHHKFESSVTHKVPVMVIELLEPTQDPANPVLSTNADDFSTFSFTPCHPSYLPDLLAPDVVINGDQPFEMVVTPFSINNFRWGGFAPNPAARNITVMPLNTVQEWQLKFPHHPFHMHINHFMLVETVDEWDQIGDWVDTVQGLVGKIKFRFITDRYAGRVTMHCHNLDHADEGSMAMAFITNDPKDPVLEREVEWEEHCNVKIMPTCDGNCLAEDWTRRPTFAPVTQSPTTVSPTFSPTTSPSVRPSHTPTKSPTLKPTKVPTGTDPTATPTDSPSLTPTKAPSLAPSLTPSKSPSIQPSAAPSTKTPTRVPNTNPSSTPTKRPTTLVPTSAPSMFPTFGPTTNKPTFSDPISLLLRGRLTINGNSNVLTPEVKNSLEVALSEELKAYTVSVLNVQDLGANRLRRLTDSTSAQSDVTSMNVRRRRSLQDGGTLPQAEQFNAQFLAIYRNEEAGVYGTQRLSKESAETMQSVMERMATASGTNTSPLQIASLVIDVDSVSPTPAPTVSAGVPAADIALIGGVSGALFLFVGVVVVVVKRTNANSKGEGKNYENRSKRKRFDNLYEPQDEPMEDEEVGVMFGRQLVEATRLVNSGNETEEDADSFYSASSRPPPSSPSNAQDSASRVTMTMLRETSRDSATGERVIAQSFDYDHRGKEEIERRRRMLSRQAAMAKARGRHGTRTADGSLMDEDTQRYHKDMGSKKAKARHSGTTSSGATISTAGSSSSSGKQRKKDRSVSNSPPERNRKSPGEKSRHDTSRDRKLGRKEESGDRATSRSKTRKNKSAGEPRSASPTKPRKQKEEGFSARSKRSKAVKGGVDSSASATTSSEEDFKRRKRRNRDGAGSKDKNKEKLHDVTKHSSSFRLYDATEFDKFPKSQSRRKEAKRR